MLLVAQRIEQVAIQTQCQDGGDAVSFVLPQLTQDILPVVVLRFDARTVHQSDVRVVRDESGNYGLTAAVDQLRILRACDRGRRTDGAHLIAPNHKDGILDRAAPGAINQPEPGEGDGCPRRSGAARPAALSRQE
jgi:hypothetical protein